jgi:purine-nucleoside phosphorylase
MSTVPEVLAARARGIRCLGFSSITNPAAGLTGESLSHKEVLEMGKDIARVLGIVIRGVLRRL